MDGHPFMQLAIEKAREGLEHGQSPFGACIVRRGEVIACEHNRVFADNDITAHAEILAIREACRKTGEIDLSGCEIYSTCEPCPMCFSACHWARLDRIIYGAAIHDAQMAGFNELTCTDRQLKQICSSPILILDGVLRDECLRLFEDYRRMQGKVY